MKMIIEDDDCDECIHEKSFINNLEETKNEARMAGAYQRPIKCAFKNGEFSSDNWNCGTLNKLSVIPEFVEFKDNIDEILNQYNEDPENDDLFRFGYAGDLMIKYVDGTLTVKYSSNVY